MALAHCTDIALPAHQQPGGFDHAAVHGASARLYVAHTANDARDVIDCATERYLHAIPNGLELDNTRQRLFCACNVQRLVCLESYSGRVLAELELSGAPDMIMLNARSGHLYAVIGDLAVIDIIDTAAMRRLETLETERGAVYVEKG